MKITAISNYKRTEGAPLSPGSPHRRVVITVRRPTLTVIRERAETRNVSFANESRRLIESGLQATRFRCCPFCGTDAPNPVTDCSSVVCRCGSIMPAEWFT